jgi:hypothetical protein
MKNFCDSFYDFSDDASNISLNEFRPICQHKEEEQGKAVADAFLETDFPFQSGKWVLVLFATKKYYVGAITSVSEGHPTVKFARRVKSTSAFIWPQTDGISERETGHFSIPPRDCGGQKRWHGISCFSFRNTSVLKFLFYFLLS